MSPPRAPLATARLTLRPSAAEDAAAAFPILADWEVSKWLRPAPFPPDPDQLAAWFAGHPAEWAEGSAYRFAICLEGALIGLVDLDEIAPGSDEATLGYWLARPHWGKGYALEAARAATAFAFGPLARAALVSGHARDHMASGRILQKLGFRPAFEGEKFFVPQNGPRPYIGYRLKRPVI